MVVNPYRRVVRAFFLNVQFIGRKGSSLALEINKYSNV